MDLLLYEKQLYDKGIRMIAGIDEVGRGPLAGPVCAAAVILPMGKEINGVNDSKKLSEKKREVLYDIIAEEAVCFSTAYVDPATIDSINIRRATHLAMENAVKALTEKVEYLLIDGNDNIDFDIPGEYIIKGDTLSLSVAAASIIAKVTRDRYMKAQAELYPEYGFEKHKGYGTKQHMEAIRKYGLCPLHRKTFMTAKVLGTA